MRKAIIGLTVVLGLALIALASVAIAVSVASAQDGRVDTPCAGYAVDVQPRRRRVRYAADSTHAAGRLSGRLSGSGRAIAH